MKRLFSITLLLTIIVACTERQSKKKAINSKGVSIVGLASPVRLQPDSTVIYLSDYFADISVVDSVFVARQKQSVENGRIVFKGQTVRVIDNIKIYAQGTHFDIPVIRSFKELFTFHFDGASHANKVAIAGNLNGWNPSAGVLIKDGEGWSRGIWLAPGLYQYQMVVDGAWMLDPNHDAQVPNGQGGFNSTFTVGNPNVVPPFIWAEKQESDLVWVGAEGKVSEKDALLAYWENEKLPTGYDDQAHAFWAKIPSRASSLSRSHLRAWLSVSASLSNDILLPLVNGVAVTDAAEIGRQDRQGNVMYFVMIDRFKDGDLTNDFPIQNDSILAKANHFGGDFDGITQVVESGYFDSLGVNTLWISPITQNPDSAFGLWDKEVTSKFSGYHGYWPVSSTKIDYHWGKEDDLRELLNALHSRSKNLLIDYVANHVHINHPLYKEHPDWATPLYLPDGTMNTEKWDEYRLTTWFDTFLATLDFSNPEVVDAMTDSALYWVEEFDIDGFRHDATKHIQHAFWRTLTHKIKSSSKTENSIFQIGETYGNPELISSYIGSGQLDAQFDFNLYDAEVGAFADSERGFGDLARVLNESLTWYGSHHLMGNITGNQDRCRFISYADGSVGFDEDAKLVGWTREVQNKDEKGFQRLQSLMLMLMTAPGIPCIYYGDEIGMPGANDPDNRRMMVFNNLNAEQTEMLDFTKKAIALRRNHMALMYGQTEVLKADEAELVFRRRYLDEEIWVVFGARNPEDCKLGIPEYAHLLMQSKYEGSAPERSFSVYAISHRP